MEDENEWIQYFSFFPGRQAQRVAILCYLLALKVGLSRADADLLRLVAPTRNMPKGYAAEGAEDLSCGHPAAAGDPYQRGRDAKEGVDIFSTPDDDIMCAAAIVAMQRHEHWDGSGYPRGLKADEIHIYGRIAGLVNVFDSLTHGSPDGEPYTMEQVVSLIRKQRGRRFDPRLVDIFLRNLDEFIAIGNRYPDED